MPSDTETHYHQCTICEAACGLELEVSGREVVSIRGDAEDAFSHGFVCPKGAALRELDADPDRLRQPLLRRDGGTCRVSWDEAFEAIERGLRPIIEQHGNDARRDLPRQPDRAQHRARHLQPGAADRLPHAQPLQRQHGRPVPEAGRVGLMFGTASQRAGARHRPQPSTCSCSARTRWPRTAACSPCPISAAACARCASAAAGSSSSTRAAARPPRSPTSTWRSGPAPTRCCSPAWCTRCSPRISSRSAGSPSGRAASTTSRGGRRVRARSSWRRAAACRPR